MSELSVTLRWQRSEPALRPGELSRAHTVRYDEGTEMAVDAAPDQGGDAANANPEHALAAAVSSCHMMTFLALAAKAAWPVERFEDRAVAHLGKGSKGRTAVTRIDLHPIVRFSGGFSVDAAALEKMHHRAHRYCFIANSLADSVEIRIGERGGA